MHVEIWSDENSKPGAKVAIIGDIDLEQLASPPGEVVHFDGLMSMEIVESADATVTHTLTISPDENGTVTKDPDIEAYPTGSEVTLTTTPNDGYAFSGWKIGEFSSAENPLTITVDGDKNVTATFREIVVPDIASIGFDPVSKAMTVSWSSIAGAIYQLEISDNLSDWYPLSTVTGAADAEMTTFIDSTGQPAPEVPQLEDNGQRFYRLREKTE